jgi:periplasmic mercuric ion binding protein
MTLQFVIALGLALALLAPGQAASAAAKPAATQTVTLQITGMHWVRSALVRVKGVRKATVSFEKKQAVVTYDPKATNVAALVKAVQNTPHMMGAGMKYSAKPAKSTS